MMKHNRFVMSSEAHVWD